MGIPVVTREYTPRACRNSRKPMRLPPRNEMRPDSPACMKSSCVFPIKHIRSLDLLDWTLGSPQCVHGLDNNVAWMSILFRVTCKFNTITIKSQRLFFCRRKKIVLYFTHTYKAPRIAKTMLKRKNKFGGLTLLYFRTYWKDTIIKIAGYWHKDRSTDQ